MPTATVNGIDMHYEQSGEGTPLLLVHGLGTGSADWEYQVPALAARYRVITPSLRGFGQSEKPAGPYSVSLYAEDMRALLDHLGVEKCHICGVSMGGAIAFQFGVDFPERLLSLTSINSQPSFVLDTPRKRFLLASRRIMSRVLGMRIEGAVMMRWNFPGRINREIRKRLAGRFVNQVAPYAAALNALEGWTVVNLLDRIKVPVLFLAAEFDYTTPAEKQSFADMIGDARVAVIAGARHATHLGRPDETNSAILSFLNEVDARADAI